MPNPPRSCDRLDDDHMTAEIHRRWGPAERITPFKCSCLSATERRTTAAKRDDLHSKSLFLVKNKGQLNAKSGPKVAYGNFAMRTKFSERLDLK